MADKLKDDADRKLELLFSSGSLPDDGFSRRVVQTVRRQMWIRRLSLPIALAIGALITLKPLLQLLAALPLLFSSLPQSVLGIGDSSGLVSGSLPQTSTIILGVSILGIIMMVSRMLEE